MSDVVYSDVLLALYPDREWKIADNDYSRLEMLDGLPKPSKATLEAAWPQVEHDRVYDQVRLARHAAYAAPDGPDAIFLQWQRGDATEQDWLDAVETVKQAHPYPPAP